MRRALLTVFIAGIVFFFSYCAHAEMRNGMNASLVVGQKDFISAVETVTQTRLDDPRGVATEGTRLFIADSDNSRVLELKKPQKTVHYYQLSAYNKEGKEDRAGVGRL